MGKYICKGKRDGGGRGGDVGGGEVGGHAQPATGVRTRARAKILAAYPRLQKHKPKPKPRRKSKPNSKSDTKPASSSPASLDFSCYMELRSRRLPRRSFPSKAQKRKANPKRSPAKSSPSLNAKRDVKVESDVRLEAEGSWGENVLEFEGNMNRNSRETTPCSLIRRDSEIVRTPGSTTRRPTSSATNRVIQSSAQRNLPTSREMDEFFSVPEKRLQKAFTEKYNFDPVKGRPLPGRYEWVKVKK